MEISNEHQINLVSALLHAVMMPRSQNFENNGRGLLTFGRKQMSVRYIDSPERELSHNTLVVEIRDKKNRAQNRTTPW